MELTDKPAEEFGLDEDTRLCLQKDADTIKAYLFQARQKEQHAKDYLAALRLENDLLLYIWQHFDSAERSALKRRYS
jgi:hypothetical protein